MDFGLDVYEPYFQRSREDWEGLGSFNIKLTVDNDDTDEIFYFCHVHNWMSGRIKICDGEGTSCVLRSATDLALYSFYSPDTFDTTCGTTNASQCVQPICPAWSCSGLPTCRLANRCIMVSQPSR